jgi:hypothetical protein
VRKVGEPRINGWHRPVLSVVALARMHGPLSGVVHLPLSVYSSGGGPAEPFDFADEDSRRGAYEIVLTNADAEEAAALLDADELLRLWPSLWLPAHVRRVWEPWLVEQRGLPMSS